MATSSRRLLAFSITLLGSCAFAHASSFSDRWTWFTSDYVHFQTATVPGDAVGANDLHVYLVHTPLTGNPPTATGMPYQSYNAGTGEMSFGTGSVTFAPGDNVAVQWESKFASDTAVSYQFTSNGSPTGSSVDLSDPTIGYSYNYNPVAHTMTVSVTNLSSTLTASYSDLRMAYMVPDSYLTQPDGAFASDAAYNEGVAVTVASTIGTLAPAQELVIGSFALDDTANINNLGYILADADFDFGNGISYRLADAGIGTAVPPPTSALGGAVLFASLIISRRFRKNPAL
ncbi:MAG TPA: hypothetical protein VFE58_10820 [Tepidisphaeraceae bacterium]|nr:hypothetical protein [Tepidisphaeraceae bacterium]